MTQTLSLSSGLHFLELSTDNNLINRVRNNPAMNRSFVGNLEVPIDHFLACYRGDKFVGAILCNYALKYTYVEIHPAIEVPKYSREVAIYAELALIWMRYHQWIPIAIIPDSMRAVQNWTEKRFGLAPTQMNSTRNILGQEVTNKLYILPDNWTPRHLSTVVFNWSN